MDCMCFRERGFSKSLTLCPYFRSLWSLVLFDFTVTIFLVVAFFGALAALRELGLSSHWFIFECIYLQCRLRSRFLVFLVC